MSPVVKTTGYTIQPLSGFLSSPISFNLIKKPCQRAIISNIRNNCSLAAILNAPVFTVIPKHLRGAGQLRRFAGNPIGGLPALLATFFVGRDTFHHEGLSHMREVQVVVKSSGDPDVAGLDATVIGAIQGTVIGFAVKLLEIEGRLFKQFF